MDTANSSCQRHGLPVPPSRGSFLCGLVPRKLDYGDDYLAGHDDLLWHPDGSRIYAGYGFRSTRGGVEEFTGAMSKMGIPVVPLQLVDPYCYHLDTCLCPLTNDAALIFSGAYSAEALASLHKPWKRVHLLTAEGQRRRDQRQLYYSLHDTSSGQKGLSPIIVDISEFEKAGGSCFCMKRWLP